MTNLKYLVAWYFNSGCDVNDPHVIRFIETHWDGTGAGWISNLSPAIAKVIVDLSLEYGPGLASERLQIVLNDLVIGKLSLIREDGIIGTQTMSRLNHILCSIRNSEESIVSMLLAS